MAAERHDEIGRFLEDGEIDGLQQVRMMTVEHDFIFITEALLALDVKRIFGTIDLDGHLQTRFHPDIW